MNLFSSVLNLPLLAAPKSPACTKFDNQKHSAKFCAVATILTFIASLT